MSKNKDPAVLFYTSDFLAGTILMTHEQRGKYILLLCLQHENGHLTENTMLHVCGEYDEMIYAKFKQDENGLYYNERMNEETEKRTAFTQSRRTSANKRYETNTSNASAERTQCVRSTYAVRMGNGNGNINGNVNENINVSINDNNANVEVTAKAPQNNVKSTANEANAIEERFNRFWSAYPKKKDKAGAKKVWAKLKPSEELLEIMLSAIERQRASPQWQKDGGQYIPYPSTWLNAKRWEDEETEVSPQSATPTYSTFNADEALDAALYRTYGDSSPRASPIETDAMDDLFLSAMARTYGNG